MSTSTTPNQQAPMQEGMKKYANRTPPMHQGRWTLEEEEYLDTLVAAFKAGVVPIAEGTTLRVFLSRMLNCPAKRISKKMVGTNYKGGQTFVRKDDGEVDEREVKKHHTKLQKMEARFITSLAPTIDWHEMNTQPKEQAEKATAHKIDAPTPAPKMDAPTPTHQDQHIPIQKLKLSNAAPTTQAGNLMEFLQAETRRVADLRSVGVQMGHRSALPTSARGLDVMSLFQTNARPMVERSILATLQQKLPPPPRTLTLEPPSAAADPSTALLLQNLKRKLEMQLMNGTFVATAGGRMAKKARK